MADLFRRLKAHPRAGVGIAASLGAIAVGVAVLLLRSGSAPGGAPIMHVLQGSVRETATTLEQRWRSETAWTPLGEAASSDAPGRDEGSWADSVAVRDPFGLAERRAIDDLLARLLEHASVRSRSSHDGYTALVERDPTIRWADPDTIRDPRNPVAGLYAHRFNEDLPSADPLAFLPRMWSRIMGEEGHRIAAIGTGEGGALVDIAKVRTAELAPGRGLTEADIDRWTRGTGSAAAAQFIEPTMTLDDVVARDGSAVVAYCYVLVRCANDRILTWRSAWALDPEPSMWFCVEMGFNIVRPGSFFF